MGVFKTFKLRFVGGCIQHIENRSSVGWQKSGSFVLFIEIENIGVGRAFADEVGLTFLFIYAAVLEVGLTAEAEGRAADDCCA